MSHYEVISTRSDYFDDVHVRPPIENDTALQIANQIGPHVESIREYDNATHIAIHTLRRDGRRDNYAHLVADALLRDGSTVDILAEHFKPRGPVDMFRQVQTAKDGPNDRRDDMDSIGLNQS